MFKNIFWALFAALMLPMVTSAQVPSADIIPYFNTSNIVKTAQIEQRGPEYRKFLAASVKIGTNEASGSGTIIYYNSKENIAYVASCGHLWKEGTVSAEQARQRNMTCDVYVYYQNEIKLKSPKKYKAKVLFYSHIREQDTSLICFTPDWEPDYFPIAPVDYKYQIGTTYHSVGSDWGTDAAHYAVKAEQTGADLITRNNPPRPGRSGGGLLDDNGYYIATCWGCEVDPQTRQPKENGVGMFTPLSAIHRYWNSQTEYAFLLHQQPFNGIAKKLPIVDKNGKQGKYTPEYVLFPNGR